MTPTLSACVLLDRVAVVHDIGIDVFVSDLDPDQAELLAAQIQIAAQKAREAAGLKAPV